MSRVMQQGDCNAPSIFQRLMTAVFRNYITWFVYVYLDDIFIYSSSIEEHEAYLVIVFNRLCEVDLYSTKMDCLGHLITDAGIHTDADKMQKI